MSKKVAVAMIVYNEEEMIKVSLGQVIDWADQIIILNGSPDGPSTDNTASVVSKIVSGKPNVLYKEGRWGTNKWEENWDKVQRNEYLKYVTSDFLFQVDADEFYSYKDLEELSRTINAPEYDKITGIFLNNIHYYGDREHYMKDIGLIDQRFTKFISGAHYNDNSVILKTPDGRSVFSTGINIRNNNITRHHFGHAVPWERYKPRVAKFIKRGEIAGTVEGLETMQDIRNLSDPKVLKYSGPYPELMQKEIDEDNPFFNHKCT